MERQGCYQGCESQGFRRDFIERKKKEKQTTEGKNSCLEINCKPSVAPDSGSLSVTMKSYRGTSFGRNYTASACEYCRGESSRELPEGTGRRVQQCHHGGPFSLPGSPAVFCPHYSKTEEHKLEPTCVTRRSSLIVDGTWRTGDLLSLCQEAWASACCLFMHSRGALGNKRPKKHSAWFRRLPLHHYNRIRRFFF